jgi:Rrf2 family protein
MYGIRAALLVSLKSEEDKESFIPIRLIAEELKVSFHFLTKILQILTQAKIMESYKGPNGGVRLANPSESVYLIDIIEAIDGTKVFSSCLIGLPNCGDEVPCPLHEEWKKSKGQLQSVFQKMSLAKLAKDTSKCTFRL